MAINDDDQADSIIDQSEAKAVADLIINFINENEIDPMLAYVGINFVKRQMEVQYGIERMEILPVPGDSELN